MAETVEVPFIKVGNRRALTDEQLCEYPWLLAFFKRFRHCFEASDRSPYIWLFIE